VTPACAAPIARGAEVLEMVMGKLAFALAIAISILPRTGHAQEKEDMTQVTCADYLRMSPSLAHLLRLDERLVQSKIQ